MAGKKREGVLAGSGNVFRDLGFPDSEDRALRVQLAVRLNELIDEHRLGQAAVAKRFGIPRLHVSDLRNYRMCRFSSERLVRFITLKEDQVSHADDVRDHCERKYIFPARRRGDQFVSIRAGDVHGDMGYKNRYPLVCSAIGAKVFEEKCRVERVAVEGPLNGANTTFRFRLNS